MKKWLWILPLLLAACATGGSCKLADAWHHSGSLVLAPQSGS